VVGIIGRNGAGKSTLLKILARITEPTSGRAEIHGRVGSLLEVGTGFHPDLTGRENIYLNGTILGMKKREIDKRFDEIVEFSGVEKFIDTPVKRYSSGMRVRLAFSVAAHLEPEILLVDEVLAVGDAEFQRKCLGKMGEVARRGRTILFVSHNLEAVEALCNRAILIKDGSIAEPGEPDDVIARYLKSQLTSSADATTSFSDSEERGCSGPIRFTHWSLVSKNLGEGRTAEAGEECEFCLFYRTTASGLPLRGLSVALVVKNSLDRPLFTIGNEFSDRTLEVDAPQGKLTCALPKLPLLPGDYRLHLWCSVNGQTSDVIRNAGSFSVVPRDVLGTGRLPRAEKHGPLIVTHNTWKCSPLNSYARW